MKAFIRKVAKTLGWSTCYHVSATYPRDSHVGFSVISLTVTVKPWIHSDNYREVVDFVEAKADRPSSTPSIISITKLGL